MKFKVLDKKDIPQIVPLVKQLNPKLSLKTIKNLQTEMFEIPTYYCFGLYDSEDLVGISSGWITVRHYSGKQIELDNLIIDSKCQSKGMGKVFLNFIEKWATENSCKTIELNTYVHNSRSHKFYYNQGFSILGFHFLKKIASYS